jgi:leader peptidase (prepilin peptidase)/N-methyltransferase
LCWGSFLNVLAYRLLHGYDWIARRSFCHHCQHVLAWYDLIPVFSWVALHGTCRYCQASISWLYPFIELLTAVAFAGLYYYISPSYWLGYGILFSALIVTIRSDLETFYILRATTLGIMPIGIVFAFLDLLPITVTESIIGGIAGYSLLWAVRWVFYRMQGQEGIGQGDLELLATIGVFTGPLGVWCSLLLGSLFGSLVGVAFLVRQRAYIRFLKIPFGPFLASGALLYILYQPTVISLLWRI